MAAGGAPAPRGRIFVFFGDTGSGKTENALNLAVRLASSCARRIHFIDLDQTKFLYRSREHAALLERLGVVVHHSPAYLDSPLIAAGVTGALMDEDSLCVLDIGGGPAGATLAGQFSEWFAREDCRSVYVLNPYRPFAGDRAHVLRNMEQTLSPVSLGRVPVLCNPCLGAGTTGEDVLSGYRRAADWLAGSGFSIRLLSVEEKLAAAVSGRVDIRVLPIKLYVRHY